jgi:predicted transcriptional regulator
VACLSERYAYVVLEAEKWWNRRYSQSKAGKTFQAFVRRGKVGPLNAELLLFYVKHPVREIRGKADFIERIVGNVDELWNKHGVETVFASYDEYREFLDGRQEATFIRFKNLQELTQPITGKSFLGKIGGGSMLSRNGRYLSKELVNALI